MRTYIIDNLDGYTEEELQHDLLLLPEWRRQQALKYRFFTGKRDCALSYLLLCKALEEVYGIKDKPSFSIGGHGKPSLKEFPHIHFNLSHCRHAVACVVSNHPVGIDVESTDREIRPALMTHTMSEEEIKWIGADRVRFFHLWTQKEALVKLTGSGLQDHLHSLLLPQNTEGIEFCTEDHREKGYILTTAIKKNI